MRNPAKKRFHLPRRLNVPVGTADMPEEKKDGVQDLLSAIAGDTADVSHRLYRLFLLEMRMAAQSMCGALAMAVAEVLVSPAACSFRMWER